MGTLYLHRPKLLPPFGADYDAASFHRKGTETAGVGFRRFLQVKYVSYSNSETARPNGEIATGRSIRRKKGATDGATAVETFGFGRQPGEEGSGADSVAGSGGCAKENT